MADRFTTLYNSITLENAFLARYHRLISLGGVFLIGLLTYGYTFFSFTYNNDGIARMQYINVPFTAGLPSGRWFYSILANVYFTSVRLPLFHGLFTVVLLLLCVLVLWNIFEIERLVERILVGGMFMSLPLFIHFFYYGGDAEVYATAMLMLVGSLLCFSWHSWQGYVSSVILIVLGLGCYPALFSFVSALFLFYVFHCYLSNYLLKQNYILLVKVIVLILFALLLYYLTTKFLVYLFDVEMTSYKNANSISIQELLSRFPYKVIWVVKLVIYYILTASIWYKASLFLAVAGIFLMIIRESKSSLLHILGGIFLFAVVTVASHATYLITYETASYPGFQFGLLIFSSLPFAYAFHIQLRHLKHLIYVTCVLCILSNVRISNEHSLKYTLRLDAGQRLVNNIMYDIHKNAEYVGRKTKIAFIGDLRDNGNYELSNPIANITSLNGLNLAPVSFSGVTMDRAIRNQMMLQGVTIETVPREQLDKYRTYASLNAIPDYPKEGSIVQVDDVMVVNLGLPTEGIEQPNSDRVKSGARKGRMKMFWDYIESKI